MSTFDLKPLSPDNIEEMNFNKEDLWLIELNGEEFGPFETESLKHYSSENKEIMQEALARRLDQDEYKDFWSHPAFQRRKMQVMNPTEDEGQYWIMHQGLKAGPLSFKEVDKKIEMNLLSMTDPISVDDGENWLKIFQFQNFDRRSHHPNDLPLAPNEENFLIAKLQVIEDLENKNSDLSDELADLAYEATHSAKVIPFRSEEVVMKPQQTHFPTTSKRKWAIPTAVAILGAVVLTGDFFSGMDEISTPEIADTKMPVYQRTPAAMAKKENRPSHKSYSPPQTYNRSPASVRPMAPSIERIENSPRYPTIVETHEDQYGNNLDYPQDRPESPVIEGEAGPKEYSLVGNDTYSPQSLDAVMNGDTAEPVVEEVSDF